MKHLRAPKKIGVIRVNSMLKRQLQRPVNIGHRERYRYPVKKAVCRKCLRSGQSPALYDSRQRIPALIRQHGRGDQFSIPGDLQDPAFLRFIQYNRQEDVRVRHQLHIVQLYNFDHGTAPLSLIIPSTG